MGHKADSIEIEDKFWVPNTKPLLNWLSKNAKFEYKKRQIDEYFTPAHVDWLAEKYPNEFFRIRNADGDFSANYKFWYKTKTDHKGSHCDEFETDLDDGDQFKKMILAMGFKSRITVDKIRSSYQYKNFEIDIDEVKDLGTFCEIEIESDYIDIPDATNQIKNFATKIGVSDISDGPDMSGGYAMMLFRKGLT